MNEIFYSLQGEGARAGAPSIFIRLSKCNLTCGFCDTEFESDETLTVEQIRSRIEIYNCKDIIWTGGEPALQLTEEIIDYFKSFNYYQCIETNGSLKIPGNIDYVCISPKVAEHVIKKNFNLRLINELRYCRSSSQLALPEPEVFADHYYISPMFNGNELDQENVNHCINLIKNNKSNKKWRLSLQIHKLIKIQ